MHGFFASLRMTEHFSGKRVDSGRRCDLERLAKALGDCGGDRDYVDGHSARGAFASEDSVIFSLGDALG